MLTVLFSLGEIWADFNIVLKIFVIMTIYSWTKSIPLARMLTS